MKNNKVKEKILINGVVKFFDDQKKFGFIKGEDKQEYFFHQSSVINLRDKIYAQDKVRFNSEYLKKGPKAINIELTNNQKNELKIIKGKIIFYNEEKGWGNILGEDRKKYFFHITNTDKPLEIKKGLFVLFISCQGSKGLFAESITIDNNLYNSSREIHITNNCSSDAYITNNYNDDDYYDNEDDYCEDCGNYTCTCYDTDDEDEDDYEEDDYEEDEETYENGYGIQNKEFSQRYYDANCPECGSKLWQYSNGYVKCGESWCDWWNYLND